MTLQEAIALYGAIHSYKDFDYKLADALDALSTFIQKGTKDLKEQSPTAANPDKNQIPF